MPRANTLFFRSPWSLVFCSTNTLRLERQLLPAPFEFSLNVFVSLQCGLLFRGPVCYSHLFFPAFGYQSRREVVVFTGGNRVVSIISGSAAIDSISISTNHGGCGFQELFRLGRGRHTGFACLPCSEEPIGGFRVFSL